MSGSLVNMGGGEAWFQNPTHGGVYRFRGRVGGSPWTQANIVLPLSGAGVDGVFAADVAAADATIAHIISHYTPTERQTVSFGRDWFHDGGVGDYLGRVDSASAPTVWLYNQVNDDTGMGAVATFCGVPTRMAKLSNFLVAYETQKLGVSGFRQWLARIIYGTFDDGTASHSWNAGIAVANGTSLSEATQAMSTNMWHQADAKERRLWPNDSATDNHTIYSFDLDFNYNFISPGFTTKRVEDD